MIGPVREISFGAPVIAEPGPGRASSGFDSVFRQAIQRVEGLRQSADESTVKLLAGENEDVHEVVLAMQRAELAFELFVEVRNKVVQAYQEIMRMQI